MIAASITTMSNTGVLFTRKGTRDAGNTIYFSGKSHNNQVHGDMCGTYAGFINIQ